MGSKHPRNREHLIVFLVVAGSFLAGCGAGGGGGGGSSAGGTGDPVIPLRGTGGTYSRTPAEANTGNGAPGTAPPVFPSSVQNGENQFIRIEFPYDVDPSSILDTDINFGPFSQLNGNITITDEAGNHLPGIATINGIDIFGNDRSVQDGWPIDPSGSGRDRNLGSGTFVYIATFPPRDLEGEELSSLAAFGGSRNDIDSDASTTEISQIRIAVNQVNGNTVDAFWTLNVGALDGSPPQIVSVTPEFSVQGDPVINGRPSAEFDTDFIVLFNEPVVPQSLGLSRLLNPTVFNGNLPRFTWPNPPAPPFPPSAVTAPIQPGTPRTQTPLFLPFDVNPVNPNNLSKYRVNPLIPLPPGTNIQVVVRATANTQPLATMDLRGNLLVGGDFTGDFETGEGPALVNAPVSPEAVYWVPANARGLGAIDLNGQGYSTNTPNAHASDQLDKISIITRLPFISTVVGRAKDGIFNPYVYPVGTGSAGLAYPGRNQTFPFFRGNPGTPVPGINEKSDGFETFVKNSAGEINLTGADAGSVGTITDLILGEPLDTVFFDTLNPFAQNGNGLRGSYMNLTIILSRVAIDRNSMADPPFPNPPPLRYPVGLPPIGFVLDTSNLDNPIGLLLEGEEVFGSGGGSDGFGAVGAGPDGNNGTADDGPLSRFMLLPNSVDPLDGPDFQPIPFTLNGPPPQTSTLSDGRGWATRQQIGNFLYVCDQTNNVVRVLNSNTMRVISNIDLPDPYGLGITSDMGQLYVSNFGDDTVSVVNADPLGSSFHQEVNRINVGSGPRAVAVQPDNEDVLVLNWREDSMDIIDIQRSQVRKSTSVLLNRPFDVVACERQNSTGYLAAIYFAYISNAGGNNIVLFESGPDLPPNPIGLDNIIGAVPDNSGQDRIDIIEPKYLTFDQGTNPDQLQAGGCFVSHRDGSGFGAVSRIQFTFQAQVGPIPRNPAPGQPVPPGFAERSFEVVSQWGTTQGARLAGTEPFAVALSDLHTARYRRQSGLPPDSSVGGNFSNNAAYGANSLNLVGVVNAKHPRHIDPNGGIVPAFIADRLYVGFTDSDVVQVLDPEVGGVIIKSIEGGRPIRRMTHFWSQ